MQADFRTISAITGTLALQLALATSISAQTTQRDSAGLRIISTRIAAPTGVIKLAPTPLFDIGGAGTSPATELTRVRGIIRLPDGTLVIANAGTQQLLYFDAAGRFVRAAGRKGEGPGEFQGIDRLLRMSGDSILVYDAMARRALIFGPTGTALATIKLLPPDGRREPSIIGALSDRTLLAGSLDVTEMIPRPRSIYVTQHLFAYGLNGEPARPLGSSGVREHFVQEKPKEAGGGVANWALAFGRQTTVQSRGDGFMVGDGATFELRTHSGTGVLKEIIRADMKPRTVTAEDRAKFSSEQFVDLPPSRKGVVERMVAEMPWPQTMPVFDRFLIGEDGRIWVLRYPRPGDPVEHWIVLGRDGGFVDEVATATGFRLMTAGASYVAGVWRDSDDVEHVRLYQIQAGNRK